MRGFALGMGLTAEAGSQAMEDIIVAASLVNQSQALFASSDDDEEEGANAFDEKRKWRTSSKTLIFFSFPSKANHERPAAGAAAPSFHLRCLPLHHRRRRGPARRGAKAEPKL